MATATATEPATDNASGRKIARFLPRLLIVLLVLLAAAKLTVFNLAAHGVRSGNAAVLALTAPASAQAAAQVAEGRFATGDYLGAEAMARRALANGLYSSVALRTLGMSLQGQGRLEQAARVMALAGGLGWRDTPTQLWLIGAYLQQGDYPAALERADALARRGREPEQMQALFMAAALDPKGRQALIARLLQRPSWRLSFFTTAETLPRDRQQAFAAFLSGFAAAGGKLDPEEVVPFTTSLFEGGQYAKAAAVWRRYGSGPETNAVADGDFEEVSLRPHYMRSINLGGRKIFTPRKPAPFEWMLLQPAGSETRLAPPPWNEGRQALNVYSPGNQRYEMARQALVLQPGRHVLRVDVAAAPGTRIEGYSWMLQCLPSGAEIVTRDAGSETMSDGRTRRRYAFEVPDGNCSAQRLSLILHSGVGRRLDLWFDNLGIEPVSGASTAPGTRPAT